MDLPVMPPVSPMLAKAVPEIPDLGHTAYPATALGPQLTAGRGQPGRRPGQHVDHAAALVLLCGPHGQVPAAIAIEVAGGQGNAKAIAGLRNPGHPVDLGAGR